MLLIKNFKCCNSSITLNFTSMEKKEDNVISQTQNWIREVVIGLNFCPFARKPFIDQRIAYRVSDAADIDAALVALRVMCLTLNEQPELETALIILPEGFQDFESYLELVYAAEDLIEDEDFEGVYQVASFHPEYLFAGSDENDPANYTNRSPYPMLHLLREDLLEIAIDKHPDTAGIPDQNIAKARSLGLEYFRKMKFD